MRKGRFSEEQMVAIIWEGDRDPVAAVAKRHGISEQTIYAWRSVSVLCRRATSSACGSLRRRKSSHWSEIGIFETRHQEGAST